MTATEIRWIFIVLIVSLIGWNAQAEEACKSGKTGKPAAVTGKEAWDLASAAALKWKPDARVFEIGTLSTGPMDDQGKATEWNIKFSSESAKAVNLISISQGSIRCWAMPGDGGRLIDFDSSIILDTNRLYDLAQKSGGEKYTAQKYKVSASLVQNPIHGPLWYFNYEDANYKQGLSVIIDAKTGKVNMVDE